MMLRIPAGGLRSAWTTLSGGWDRQCWFHCTNGKLSLRKVEHSQVRGSVLCQWVFIPWGSNTASCPCGELLAQKLHAQASSEAELLVSESPSIITGLIHLSGPGSQGFESSQTGRSELTGCYVSLLLALPPPCCLYMLGCAGLNRSLSFLLCSQSLQQHFSNFQAHTNHMQILLKYRF